MIVWLWLYATRLPAMKRAGIDLSKRRGGRGKDLDGVLPDKVQWVSHNYNHLLEQPPLFYAVVIALALLGDASAISLGLAWAYVALRVAHSLVQILSNRVPVRFLLFALSSACLILLVVRLLGAAFA